VLRITDDNRRWWTLIGACIGLFLLFLDSTAVTLALPDVQRELGVSDETLQWMINGYLLTILVLVIPAGRLGDISGRRRVYFAGLIAFALGSLVTAAAQGDAALIGGRLVQGVGAGSMLTLSLAIVSNAFSAAERPRALGIWTAVSAIALGIGPLLGGAVVEALSWRWIFGVNPPLAALSIAILIASTRETRDETAPRRLDYPGIALATVGLTAIVLALVQSGAWGLGSALTLGLIAGGFAVLAVFWVVEGRVDAPMVDFELFRNGPYFGAAAAAFVVVGCWWAVVFFIPQYIQNVLDDSAFVSGLLILPATLPMIAISPFTGRLMSAFGARAVMTAGVALVGIGMFLMTRITADSGYPLLGAAMFVFGIGLGFVYGPMSTAAMSAMPRAKAGIAAGVFGMTRFMAGALGLALVGAVFHELENDKQDELIADRVVSPDERGELDGLLAGSDAAHRALAGLAPEVQRRVEDAVTEAFTFAFARSFWLLVGLAVVGTVVTWLLVRSPGPPQAPGDDPAPDHVRHRQFHL